MFSSNKNKLKNDTVKSKATRMIIFSIPGTECLQLKNIQMNTQKHKARIFRKHRENRHNRESESQGL